MSAFVKLTDTHRALTWVNLGLVRYMERLPIWEGTPYSDQLDDGTWRETIVGAKPERTRLTFGATASNDITDEDFVEVLETPEQILQIAAGGRVT